MRKPEAYIWDVDGTLADTERDGHRVAFNQAFQKFGLPIEWTETLYGQLLAITGGKERIQFYLSHNPTLPQLSSHDIETVHKMKTEFYLELLTTGTIPLRPGVARLLRQAKTAHIQLAIATTTTPDNVTALLKQTLGEQSRNWFSIIAAGDIVPRKKPAPDIYQVVLQHLGIPPHLAIAFEDSKNGYESARSADIPVIMTVNAYTQQDIFPKALAVLEHLGEPHHPAKRLDRLTDAPLSVTPGIIQQWFAQIK